MLEKICKEFDEYAGDTVMDGLEECIHKQIEMIENIKEARKNDMKMGAFSKNMKNCFMSQKPCPQLKGYGGECLEIFENKKVKAMKSKLKKIRK